VIGSRAKFRRSAQYLADLSIVFFSWLAAYPIRFKLLPLHIQHVPLFSTYVWLALLALLTWAVVLRMRPLFGADGTGGLQRELFIGLQSHFLAFFAFVVMAFFIAAYRPSRLVLFIFFTLSTVGVVLVRLAAHRIQISRFAQGKGLSRVLVVGTGELAKNLVRRINARRDLGHQVVGLLSDNPEENGREIDGLPVLGTVEMVDQVVERERIDRVFVALPLPAHERLRVVLANLENEMVDIKVVPDLMDYVVLRSAVEEFEGLPVISLKQVPISPWGMVFKRIFDFSFSLAVLVLGGPVFLAIALAIKLTSRGPVFYRQERMGLDGKKFDILKFRSMRVDAERQTGAVWAVRDDDRCTPVGSFIRRTNLDELPQFINVLRGEMSVVGPRPERPVFIDQFRKQIPKYMLRHKMKSGLTGWAQVKGWRGNTDLGSRIECDLYYIENWSFWLDLRIIWMTVFSRESRKNAY